MAIIVMDTIHIRVMEVSDRLDMDLQAMVVNSEEDMVDLEIEEDSVGVDSVEVALEVELVGMGDMADLALTRRRVVLV